MVKTWVMNGYERLWQLCYGHPCQFWNPCHGYPHPYSLDPWHILGWYPVVSSSMACVCPTKNLRSWENLRKWRPLVAPVSCNQTMEISLYNISGWWFLQS